MTPLQQDPTANSCSSSKNAAQPVVFLPGIIMPAALRYAPLLVELGDTVCPLVKDLEVYATPTPPREYTIAREVEGISRAADAAGFARFHLYGHSAGGACALAYAATYPDRVLSLALDEPASDFSAEAQAALRAHLRELDSLAPAERMRAFLQSQLAPGVEPPPHPRDQPPTGCDRDRPASRRSSAPCCVTTSRRNGSAPSPAPSTTATAVSAIRPGWPCAIGWPRVFADFTAEEYVGLHHLKTSHQSDPDRVATALRRLWN